MDESSDLEQYQSNGVLDYLLSLQKQGVVRHIGLSSHTPEVAMQVLDWNLIDMLMFSYQPCLRLPARGICQWQRRPADGSIPALRSPRSGISVMKAFSGGQTAQRQDLPLPASSHRISNVWPTLWTNRGVLTVLPRNPQPQDLKRLLGFLEATPEEKDYSILGSFTPREAEGICVYCNHCQPCPRRVGRVGLINKYYDLAKPGTSWRRSLSKPTGSCFRLHPVRALRRPLPLPGKADGTDGRNQRVFWKNKIDLGSSPRQSAVGNFLFL